MIKLLIGGYAQGKLEYAKRQLPDAELVDLADEMQKMTQNALIVYHLELLVRRICESHHDDSVVDEQQLTDEIWEQLERYLQERTADIIFISTEVGNGIIPMERAERVWREILGRVLVRLAARADYVERIICGMSQSIK
ncbi:bifunctional adenosylcobinamide kinase/adenosylcobinamide-phosphate guanylyltransferase [Agathobacter sp.]|uniref:bifunctional adenosylcobinamide kinase/adenosylcobinamide-phosphate guanylyltransferase n=1 Tax=Agathobacter sp. TaxID=2021311 RepID=UPI002585BDDA|nr:bifunctional adenosylcobinamide kinase/adenosylcobinamide-phosphate guanylyltransferase [Agathobacter sp.]